MKPIYRIIAAFLIGPVLYMSMAFTMFRTECLHTGNVQWEFYQPVDCLRMEKQHQSPKKERHKCCHHKETCTAADHSGSDEVKGKCCTNEIVNGYVEVESLMQDVEDIQPVSFELFWLDQNTVAGLVQNPSTGKIHVTRPPPEPISQRLSTLQVYRL